MRKSIREDWRFTLTAVRVGARDDPADCRVGLEPGDEFEFGYECPAGFCPKTMAQVHALCEAVRAGGDLRLLGGRAADEIDFVCADGVVKLRLRARRV